MHREGQHDIYPREVEGSRDGAAPWSAFSEPALEHELAKNPRILMLADISGLGPGYHVGDEAMAEVAIERLKALVGKDKLVMACSSPKGVTDTYGIASIAYYNRSDQRRGQMWLKRPLSSFKGFLVMLYQLLRCDLVFVCGGGNLTSVWPGVLESRMFLFSWALRLRKRLILVSQTLGPFSPEHKLRCQRLLSKADWVGVRDRSFSEREIGFPVQFALDDAVFLKPRHSELSQSVLATHKPLMGLSLRKFGRSTDKQLYELSAAVHKLSTKQNLNTVFIPHHSPQGRGDSEIAERVRGIWSGNSRFIALSPIPRASALKALTRECEWVITMRYHQLIFALSTGVPAVGVYVDEYTRAKLNGAFEQFDLEARIVAIENASEQLENMVVQALDERDLFQSAARKAKENSLADNLRAFNRIKERDAK